MSPTAPLPVRPSIILSETDADRLFLLSERTPGEPLGLAEELERAEVLPDGKVPSDVVGMGAKVEFVDETHGDARTVQLVYPARADVAAGRLSVMTPVGAALIGLREGQTIDWPDRDGRPRALKVTKVTRDG